MDNGSEITDTIVPPDPLKGKFGYPNFRMKCHPEMISREPTTFSLRKLPPQSRLAVIATERDADNPGSVSSLTEAVMGITGGLCRIADALEAVAEAIHPKPINPSEWCGSGEPDDSETE
jgi:hypothetical protein